MGLGADPQCSMGLQPWSERHRSGRGRRCQGRLQHGGCKLGQLLKHGGF